MDVYMNNTKVIIRLKPGITFWQEFREIRDLLSDFLQHRQVELVEEAKGQSSPVHHHAAWRRGVEGHLLSQ